MKPDFSGVGNGWYSFSGVWYYVKDGAAVTGWLKWYGSWYYLDPVNDGAMSVGWTTVGTDRFYMNGSGAMQTGWVYDNSHWYYFSSYGSQVMGWLKWYGSWYYLDPANDGAMSVGWTTVGINRFYMNGSGAMQTGWVYDNSRWYYLNSYGAMVTGWLKKGSVWTVKWYYLDPAQDGAMVTGWMDIGSARYYFSPSGIMKSRCWFYDNDNAAYYYFTVNGPMAKGWMFLGGSDYYFYTDDDAASLGVPVGTMAHDTEIQSRLIDSEGAAAVPVYEGLSAADIIVSRAQYYSSDTSNLILVDRSTCRLYIFSGSVNNWSLIKTWKCSPGYWSSPTPRGTFAVMDRGYYFDSEDARCFWWTQFYGSYCMHSILYHQNGYSSATVMNSTLGYRISHGCIRLATSNAYWMYCNIKNGTTVVIY